MHDNGKKDLLASSLNTTNLTKCTGLLFYKLQNIRPSRHCYEIIEPLWPVLLAEKSLEI